VNNLREKSGLVDVAGPAAELIFGDWYPAMRVGGLRAGKTAKAMLLGVPLLVGRKKNDGKAVCHAGSLSASGDSVVGGWFDGEDGDLQIPWLAVLSRVRGSAERIPSLTSHETLDATKIFAGAFLARSGMGCVRCMFLRRVQVGRRGELPAVPEGAEVFGAVPHGASDGGTALQCGSRDYRVDGSRRMGPLCIRRGGGGARRASMRRRSTLSRLRTAENKGGMPDFGCRRMRLVRTRRLINCWGFMGSRLRRR